MDHLQLDVPEERRAEPAPAGEDATALADAFAARYGAPPEGVWAAPGRVNLIGEHTDYNDGFVLPFALPQTARVAVRRRTDGRVRGASVQVDGEFIAEPDLEPGRMTGWGAVLAGVVWALRTAGHDVHGVDVLLDSDVPLGAGLSSSAALECSLALALSELSGLDLDRAELARLARRAENDFVGVPSGVMDQAASLLCQAGHALFLDTRSGKSQQVPLSLGPRGLEILVVDTRAPHQLADGQYAERRASCERAARALALPALRDATVADLERLDDDTIRRRARHVVTENDRVGAVVRLLAEGHVREIGPFLTASHASLRDDFEVTVPELDVAVEALLGAGALGARMTGGGFGGCVIGLMRAETMLEGAEAVTAAFARRGFAAPVTFAATPAPGARRLL